MPLTYEDRRVVDDTRFTVVRPSIREWNLQIRDSEVDDTGQYLCTINTNPIRSKFVTLVVQGYSICITAGLLTDFEAICLLTGGND
jgi:hypothetical protein